MFCDQMNMKAMFALTVLNCFRFGR